MSLEGSTPLSHNSIEDNGKAAVAISDVNDNWAGYNTCHLYAPWIYNTTIIILYH